MAVAAWEQEGVLVYCRSGGEGCPVDGRRERKVCVAAGSGVPALPANGRERAYGYTWSGRVRENPAGVRGEGVLSNET